MSKATETAKKAAESSASATANTESNLVVGQWNSLRSVKTHNPDALKKDDLWSVPPQALEEEPGFNVRGSFLDGDYFETPEAKERIESLAQAYTDGRFVPPITVKVKDGHNAAIEKAELNKRSGKFTVVLDADMMDKLMKLREVLNPKEDASATDDKQASLLEESA